MFFSKTINVHGLLGNQHFELPLNFGWTMLIWTENRHFPFFLFQCSVTNRAIFWWKDNIFTSISYISNYRYYLRYNFSCSHNKYRIPFSHSFFSEFIIIMKCCAFDNYACHINWFKIRHRCYSTSSPHRMFDRKNFSSYLFGWKFIRNRVSWMMFCSS